MYNNTMARPIIKSEEEPKQSHDSVSGDILKTVDRCDRCGAQAFVMIKGSTGDLLFCGHHYDKIMNNPDAYTKMMAFMLEIVDERHKLIQNKLVGSHN
jgi:ribosomal protein L37E